MGWAEGLGDPRCPGAPLTGAGGTNSCLSNRGRVLPFSFSSLLSSPGPFFLEVAAWQGAGAAEQRTPSSPHTPQAGSQRPGASPGYSQVQRVRVPLHLLHGQHEVGDGVKRPGLVLVKLTVLLGQLGAKPKLCRGLGKQCSPPNPGQAVQPRYRYKINTWIDTRSIPGLKPPGCFCPHHRPRPHLVKFAQLQGPAPIQVEAGAQRGAGHLLRVGRRGLGAPRLCHGGGSWAVQGDGFSTPAWEIPGWFSPAEHPFFPSSSPQVTRTR